MIAELPRTAGRPKPMTEVQPANRSAHEIRALLATAFPRDPDRPHGGVEAVSVVLAAALARIDGMRVEVVTCDRDRREVDIQSWNGFRIHRLPSRGFTTLTHALWSGRQTVAEYVRSLKPDIIHAHDVYGLMVKGVDLPRVFTIHGFIHEDTRVSRGRFSRLRSWLWRPIEIGGWADQPHIVSISPYVRERVSRLVPSTIHDIENPVAEEFFEISRREQPGTIFSAALVCPRKNTIGLVEAFAAVADTHPGARLRLAGALSDLEYAARVRTRMAQLGIQDRVDLLGALDMAAVRRELAGASVFALVSLEEGAPMGIAEAMAAGVPVVASDRCGIPYMVREGRSGFLVNPRDTGEIAERLAHLLDDAELRSDMGRCGRRIAEEHYHPRSVAERTREVYVRAIREFRAAHTRTGSGSAAPDIRGERA